MPPTDTYTVQCDYKKNQYYDKQGDICRTCDKCPRGWEPASIENSYLDIDPVNGALGCRPCIRCQKQFYSDDFSYNKCQPCTDCQKEGRYEKQPCSITRNAVCGDFLPNRSPSNGSSGLQTEYIILIVSLLALAVGVVVLLVFLYLYMKKKRSKLRKDNEAGESGKDLLSSGTLSTTTTFTTSGSTVSNCDTVTDGEPDSQYGSDVSDQQASFRKIEEWKLAHDSSTELSHRHAQMISKYIAVDNQFYGIGIQLGVQDVDIKIIQADYSQSVEKQAYETLNKWKQLKASEATVFNFLDVLLRLKLYKIAEIFCDKYDETDVNT